MSTPCVGQLAPDIIENRISVTAGAQDKGDRAMPDALILEFTGGTADQYMAVNAVLGIDPATGEGDWPTGLVSHTGSTGASGDLLVFEVSDSRESQEIFMASRLGPALGQVGVPKPTRIEWLSVLAHRSD
jgi:hypothetical protein